MSFNGSGTFSLAAGNPVVSGTTIQSTWANNTLSDIASGLSLCLVRDGQSAMTGDLPMGGKSIANALNGTFSGTLTSGNTVVTGTTIPANGMYLPATNTLGFATNANLRLSIDANGKMILAAPTSGQAVADFAPTLGSGYVRFPFQFSIGASGGDYPYAGYNFAATASTGVYNYSATDFASIVRFPSGGIVLATAPSGTAGNPITFTSRLSITQGGNLTIAAPASSFHQINTFTNNRLGIQITDGVNYTGSIGRSTDSANAFWVGAEAGNNLVLGGGGTTGLTIGTTGKLTIASIQVGMIAASGSLAGPATLDFTNSNAGTTADIYQRFLNGTSTMSIGITGTGFTGSFFSSGSITGQMGFMGTQSNIPLAIGTNNIERIAIAAGGAVAIAAPSSAGATLTLAALAGSRVLSVSPPGGGLAPVLINAGAAGTPTLALNNSGTTGATAPVLTANKPTGAGTAIAAWLPIDVDGTTRYVPAWQ